jgi:hypothetical protein
MSFFGPPRRPARAPASRTRRAARPRFQPGLEAMEDRTVPAILTVTGVGDTIAVDSVVTLREALTAANTNAPAGDAFAGEVGLDTIKFNIPGGGVQTIHLNGPLPIISEELVIDGYTQGVASANTLPVGDNANLLVELDGSGAGVSASGLVIDAGAAGSTVRGLVINRFGGTGISVLQTNNVTIAGNFIGTDPTGTLDRGNGDGGNGAGVRLFDTIASTVGGKTPAARNVISGNGIGVALDGGGSGSSANTLLNNYIGTDATGLAALGNSDVGVRVIKGGSNVIGAAGMGNVISGNHFGIVIEGDNNVIAGNFIGTDGTGTKALPNAYDGVAILLGIGNHIGGPDPGAGNVLAGNGFDGVTLQTSSNVVQGNRIGVASDGSPLGNGRAGVLVAGSNNNLIGGTASGAGNEIAFNAQEGVYVFGLTSSPGNAILGNSIHDNQKLGINLATDLSQTGVTPNDTGDGDPGANQLQNFPVLTSAVTTPTSTTIQGTLNSTANTTFRVELFGNAAPDMSGFGQGQKFLGFVDVTTDAGGNAAFTANVGAVPAGQFLSATATDPQNNTSEFSAVVQVVDAPVPAPAPTPAGTPTTPAALQVQTYHGKIVYLGQVRGTWQLALVNDASGLAVGGKLLLVLPGLPRGVKLHKGKGIIIGRTRHGSPTVTIELTGPQALKALRLLRRFSNPLRPPIMGVPRLLAAFGL